MFKQYLQITKPGIVISNLISMTSGFLLASKGKINFSLLTFVATGVMMIIASSCILNNYIDKDIDQYMRRTKNRVLVKGLISPVNSLIYATLLGISGFMLLWFGVNPLTSLLGIFGFLVYVGIYSLYMKRHSIYSTAIGSFSGALPPVIGYCAVTNKFDKIAFTLATIFSLWQIPHFYSITIFHLKDYRAANIPILPIKKGILVTKNHIVLHIIAFAISTLSLYLNGYTGYKYLIVTIIINFLWLIIALYGYIISDDKLWARKIFLFSIITITLLSIMISIDFIY